MRYIVGDGGSPMADGNGNGAQQKGPRLTDYGEPEVDIQHLEALLAEDPDNIDLLDLAAFAYYSAGHLVKARRAYEKLVAIDDSHPSHHFYLGNTLYKLNLYEEADKQWEIVETLDVLGKYGEKARERREKLAELLT